MKKLLATLLVISMVSVVVLTIMVVVQQMKISELEKGTKAGNGSSDVYWHKYEDYYVSFDYPDKPLDIERKIMAGYLSYTFQDIVYDRAISVSVMVSEAEKPNDQTDDNAFAKALNSDNHEYTEDGVIYYVSWEQYDDCHVMISGQMQTADHDVFLRVIKSVKLKQPISEMMQKTQDVEYFDVRKIYVCQ